MRRASWYEALFRPHRSRPHDIVFDLLWLLGLIALLIGTGIGLRDPWPADEPRFALIARDMAASGEWLIPRVGGEVYADKPPLYFWLMAAAFELTGSLRGFLLPSLLSAIGCVVLVYDLARRLWNRETGLIAGVALLFTVQFVWQARQAQIDATLCWWTTLSLYGLLRHLLLGPRWDWYCIGWAAAGFGVITKGVGFLPLLVLLPYALSRDAAWTPRINARLDARWLLSPLALLAAIAVWLVLMLMAAQNDPSLTAYRDEILLQQTLTRYAYAWHHREPFWYFLIEVIPWLWLPMTAWLPWLIPHWRRAWHERDLRVTLLMSWVALVVLFFSLSSGKRGVYVLPAVPAFVLMCAPYLREIAQRAAAQRALFAVMALVALGVTATIAFALMHPERRIDLREMYGLDALQPAMLLAVVLVIIGALTRPSRGVATFGAGMGAVLLVVSFWINPQMNAARSGEAFIARVAQAVPANAPLGFVAFKEQYLLQVQRPVVHFGHARWRDGEQEAMDAARWLVQSPTHRLVVTGTVLERCFSRAARTSLGMANRSEWFVVSGWAAPNCVRGGDAARAYSYVPPHLAAAGALRAGDFGRHTHER